MFIWKRTDSQMEKVIRLILLCGLGSSQDNFDPLKENLALKGTANQTSIYSPYVAVRAKDGLIRLTSACSITAYETSPWWRLDLLQSYKIGTVVITNRDCCAEQTNGAEIRIGDSLENNGNNNPICAVISGLLVGSSVSYLCNGTVGRYVNVVMTGRTAHLSLCEVEVYETENLALNGTVAQSSVYSSGVPEKAIDGVRYAPNASSTCSITANESNSWWRLDLLDSYNISSVVVTARKSCCNEQINGTEIHIGDSPVNNGNNNFRCAVLSNVVAGDSVIITSCKGINGRYVNLFLPVLHNLTVCEVEVYTSENLARKGKATQSSEYTPWVAKTAIDGKNSTCFITAYQAKPWWRLDLLNNYSISSVSVRKRDCCADQTNGAEIRIGNSLENEGNDNPICAVISDLPVSTSVHYSCNGMKGRYVNVVKTEQTAYLSLCEVEVYEIVHHRKKVFLRLKLSSNVDVAAVSDKILRQVQLHMSDFNVSWTKLPQQELKHKQNTGSCVKI